MRTISLFIICLVTYYVHAQDFVIGGQAKPATVATKSAKSEQTSVKEKYDSLTNFQGYPGRVMIGQEFTYYNTMDYTSSPFYYIPYPWKDGRLRSGRYTSSQTAKDAYLEELKEKSGTKYKLTEIVTYEGKPAYVFTDNNGESILYQNIGYVNWEFVCEGYKEKFRNTYVGKDVLYLADNQNMNSFDLIGIQNAFIGLNSREIIQTLPNMSKWTIKGLGVDTTYYGEKSYPKDGQNGFCRLVFVIHNDELGDYEAFVESSGLMYKGTLKNQSPKFILTNMLVQCPLPWGEKISTRNWNGTIPSEILSSARNGDPDAIYATINYSNFAVYHDRNSINITLDDYISLLDKAIDLGYTHPQTSKWLYEIGHHFIRYSIEDENDNRNDYKRGAPFLIKAADLGEKRAIKVLNECIEKGKIKDIRTIK